MRKFFENAVAAYRPQRHLLDDAAITLAVNLLGTLLLFLTQVLLARLMGVSEFSLYTFSFTILTTASMLSTFGFHLSILRFVPTAVAHEDWAKLRGFMRRAVQSTMIVSISIGLLVAAAAWLFAPHLTPGLPRSLIVTAVAIPAACLLLLYSAYARALKRPLLSAAPRLLLKPLAFGALAGLIALTDPPLLADRTIVAETLANLLAVAFLALAIASTIRPLVGHVTPSYDTRLWIGVSFPLFLSSGFQLLTRQTDILMLGSFMGANTVGPYAAASRISQMAAFGLLSINAVLPGIVAKHMAKGELEVARQTVDVATLATFLFSASAAAAIWIFTNILLGWFGHGFADAAAILHILIIGQIINAMTGSASFILAVTGHEKILAKIVIKTMFLNAMLCGLLIPLFGPKGAAVGVTLSTSWANVLLVVICTRRTGIDASIYGALKGILGR